MIGLTAWSTVYFPILLACRYESNY